LQKEFAPVTKEASETRIYRLWGEASIHQYCHVQYPNVPMLTLCSSREACDGHFIEVNVDEMVEASTSDEALDNSLSAYELISSIAGAGDGLGPTWSGRPKIQPQPKRKARSGREITHRH
jgi:hypothetical protein